MHDASPVETLESLIRKPPKLQNLFSCKFLHDSLTPQLPLHYLSNLSADPLGHSFSDFGQMPDDNLFRGFNR